MFSKKRLLLNAVTFIPGVLSLPVVRRRVTSRSLGTRGTEQARYCYSVWLRHLVSAHVNGLSDNPVNVAELGPGSSIGIGLCAMLTGAERYYAFDVVAHANTAGNIAVFEELVELFRGRYAIPGPDEFPRVGPELADYAFPAFLTAERMNRALQPERLARIRASLRDPAGPGSMIQYRVPWNSRDAIERDTIDMVFSQAVLEHVDDLPDVYRAMQEWLRPNGFMSHQIDFKCHDSAREWNGHWTYSNLMWKLARGKQVWLINREPHSTHLKLLEDHGLRIAEDKAVHRVSRISRRQLAQRFKSLTDSDLTTCDAFIQAVKTTAATNRAASAG